VVVNATSSIDPVDLGDVLAEIARVAATEPALTPRPIEDLRAAASRGNVVVLRHDGGLIGWGVREVLRPGLAEIGMMYIKPAFRTPAAFIRLARELANVPEALSFFQGQIDSAGSFEYIYETARYVYGDALTGKAQDPARIPDLAALKALAGQAPFKDQKPSITR
jgi:hypothetical protein